MTITASRHITLKMTAETFAEILVTGSGKQSIEFTNARTV
jgi:hypothetical protein